MLSDELPDPEQRIRIRLRTGVAAQGVAQSSPSADSSTAQPTAPRSSYLYGSQPNQFPALTYQTQRVGEPTAPTQPTQPTQPSAPTAPTAPTVPGGSKNAGDPYWFTPGANSWQPTPDSPYDLSRHGTYNTPLQYFQYLLSQGIDPKTATDYINQSFQANAGGYNFGTGAKWYGDQGTKGVVGLPDEYLSFEDGQWKSTKRSGAGAPAGATASAVSPFTQQIRKILMDRLAADAAPVDENSAEIAVPFGAAKATAQRTQEGERRALAERLYAQGGLNTNELNQGIQQSAERTAVGLGSTKAQLISRVYQQKAQQLQQDLQMALASGDAESAREIQLALANLQATLTREGYGIDLAKFQQGQNTTTVGAGG